MSKCVGDTVLGEERLCPKFLVLDSPLPAEPPLLRVCPAGPPHCSSAALLPAGRRDQRWRPSSSRRSPRAPGSARLHNPPPDAPPLLPRSQAGGEAGSGRARCNRGRGRSRSSPRLSPLSARADESQTRPAGSGARSQRELNAPVSPSRAAVPAVPVRPLGGRLPGYPEVAGNGALGSSDRPGCHLGSSSEY
ncbi:hypothetical protein NDU88_008307 [Pleurodeles waltl]|uniref:Uncharacterized protein n=1 Tax=Pleurodeles waltl TaxID=8319 RepID=A0AAV7QSG1_PLEWA|nr:hypothetical protein NDU88_008307 [Pleurodeles waltl]